MISRIDHISIAVPDDDEAHAFFSTLFGAVPGASAGDDPLQYYWRIYSLGDLSRLEILKPTGENSFLKGFFEKNPRGGVHHMTLETPNIEQVKAVLTEKEIPYFGYAAYGDIWKELFIHPRDAFGVLIQIAEFNPDDFLDESVKLPAGQKWSLRKGARGTHLKLAHPGGGTSEILLSEKEKARLIEALKG